MKTSPFTTVLWRIFLHCLPRSSSQWNQAMELSRDAYDELVNGYLLDSKKIRDHNSDAEHLNHPLSQEENVNIQELNDLFRSNPDFSLRVYGINIMFMWN